MVLVPLTIAGLRCDVGVVPTLLHSRLAISSESFSRDDFRLRELVVASHICRLASRDAAKSLLSTLVSESSGECRLVSVMAYLPSTDSRGVEHPHDTPLIPSSGHQLSPIGPNPSEEYNGYRFYHIKRRRTSFCICCSRGDSHKPRIQPTGVADQTSK